MFINNLKSVFHNANDGSGAGGNPAPPPAAGTGYTESDITAAKEQAVQSFKDSFGNMYAQKDVDTLIETNKQSAIREMQESEDYKAFQGWLGNADEREAQTNKLNELQSTNEKYEKDIKDYNTKFTLINGGIDPAKVDYAILDISKSDIDITDKSALDKYLETSIHKIDYSYTKPSPQQNINTNITGVNRNVD